MKTEKRKIQINYAIAAGLLSLFILFTIAIRHVDVQPIGPHGSRVGFAQINQYFHTVLGVNWLLYTITDWLSIAVVLLVFGFAVVGLVQWISRKSLLRVDSSILVLEGFYLLVFLTYLFFELFVINYRPVLMDGVLEASYPSSTTNADAVRCANGYHAVSPLDFKQKSKEYDPCFLCRLCRFDGHWTVFFWCALVYRYCRRNAA